MRQEERMGLILEQLAADGSKVGRLAFARICDVRPVHEPITDASAPAPELQRMAHVGIVITTV